MDLDDKGVMRGRTRDTVTIVTSNFRGMLLEVRLDKKRQEQLFPFHLLSTIALDRSSRWECGPRRPHLDLITSSEFQDVFRASPNDSSCGLRAEFHIKPPMARNQGYKAHKVLKQLAQR